MSAAARLGWRDPRGSLFELGSKRDPGRLIVEPCQRFNLGFNLVVKLDLIRFTDRENSAVLN